MSKRKSNLDERQEQKLLEIERNGFWLAFFGLFLVIVVQAIIGEADVRGEMVILLLSAAYVIGDCVKNGIWDRKFQPNLKTNIIGSVASGSTVVLVVYSMAYKGETDKDIAIKAALRYGFATFVLVLFLLSIMVFAYKRRLRTLEAENVNSLDDK